MKTLFNLLRLPALLLALVVTLAPARAGGSADSKFGVEKFGDVAVRNLALAVNDALDRRKITVAIVARAGRPRSELPRGIRYTHVAFVVFEPVRTAAGAISYTYTVYNLYQSDDADHADRSYLKQDFTYDFVAGTAERDIAVCVPCEALQQRILRVIRSPAYRALYNPHYNLVANPWVDRFDNCATHTLKICFAAIYQTDDRSRLYDDIHRYFKPARIHLGLLQSIGSNFMQAVSHDDMDPSGLQTATYGSIEAFLKSNGLEQESFSVVMN